MLFPRSCCIYFYFLFVTSDNGVGLHTAPPTPTEDRGRRRQTAPDRQVAGLISWGPAYEAGLGGPRMRRPPARTFKVSAEASGVHSHVQWVTVSPTPCALQAGSGSSSQGGSGAQKVHSEDRGPDCPGATDGSAGAHVPSSTSSNQRDLTYDSAVAFPRTVYVGEKDERARWTESPTYGHRHTAQFRTVVLGGLIGGNSFPFSISLVPGDFSGLVLSFIKWG